MTIPPRLTAAALAFASLLLVVLALPALAQIQGPKQPDPSGLDITGTAAGFNPNQDFEHIMGGVVGWGVGMLGLVFFLFILVGGYLWLTAGSNEEKVKKAKEIIGTSISGLLIVFLAYALASAVVNALVSATT